jgi:phage terminase large subunit GpA-like protein
MPDEYYKQITGEVCKLTEDSKGRTKTTWEKSFDAVEALDCAVYTLALYKICGFHLWPESKWGKGLSQKTL